LPVGGWQLFEKRVLKEVKSEKRCKSRIVSAPDRKRQSAMAAGHKKCWFFRGFYGIL
jgi:hypothetical protein